MEWQKEWLANNSAYQEQYDIRVICQSPSHDEHVVLGQYTRVDSRMRAPGTDVSLRDDFEFVGTGFPLPEYDGHTRQHDGGMYSTLLAHDGDQTLSQYDSARRPTRTHHELECRQCGYKVTVRDENIQPILKQMDGHATELPLQMLDTLLENQHR